MSSVLIVQAIQSILQAVVPDLPVLLGIPLRVNDSALIYVYYQGYTEIPKTTTNIQRTHTIPIHLIVNSAADDAETELQMMAYNDAIADVFYTNRLLNGNAASSQIKPGAGANAPAYIMYDAVMYRHRWWTLEVIEYKTFVYQ